MKDVSCVSRSIGLWVWASMLIGIALFGCDAAEPIRIGFVGGTSGRVADLGISGRDAVQLVVERCNRNGGIHGREVQLLVKDDKQDPDLARKAVRELIGDNVAAIIGPMTSDMGIAVVPLLNEAHIIAVSPTVTTQQLSGLDDYFFRTCATAFDYATKSAKYHIKTADMRRVAAVYDLNNRSFCENWLKHFTIAFNAGGGEILTSIGFRANEERTFMDITRELMALGPDGILVISNSMDAAMFCQQIRKIDHAIPITLADWGATERLLELGGSAVEGVTVVQTFDRDNRSPSYQDYREVYMARYNREPGFPGVFAHDAAQVVLTALREKKEGQDLKETILQKRRFEGLQNEITFDDFGDVNRSYASISVVRNRKFFVLE